MHIFNLPTLALLSLSGYTFITPTIFSVSSKVSFDSTFKLLLKEGCKEIETEGSSKDKLLSCLGNKHYLYNKDTSSIQQIKTLVTLGVTGNQVSAEFSGGKKDTLTISAQSLETFRKLISQDNLTGPEG